MNALLGYPEMHNNNYAQVSNCHVNIVCHPVNCDVVDLPIVNTADVTYRN